MPDIFDRIALEERTQGDIFDRISLEETSRSSSTQFPRHLARIGSRVVESLLGLPGDVLRTAGVGAKGLEKGASKIREKIGLSPIGEREFKKPVPGSDELREFSTKVFGETVTPQNKTESFIDDIVSDASVLAIPIKGKIPFVRSIGTAIAGNIGQEAAKEFGFEEKGQAAAKLGSFFLAGLTGRGNVKKYWNQQYKLAEEAVPSKVRVDAHVLDNKLDNLQRQLRKGGIETPSQRFVEKPIEDLKKVIHDGEIRVEDAIAAKKKINELRSSLFDEVKGSAGQKYARTKINDVAAYLDEAIASYGKENPQFYKHWKAANEAYGGFQQSRRVGNWISRNLPFGRLGKAGLIIVEALFKPASLKVTLPGVAAFKGGELVARLMQNSTLRRYYGNLMKDAIKENKSGVLRNLRGMEKEIEKNEPDIFDRLGRQDNSNKNSD